MVGLLLAFSGARCIYLVTIRSMVVRQVGAKPDPRSNEGFPVACIRQPRDAHEFATVQARERGVDHFTCFHDHRCRQAGNIDARTLPYFRAGYPGQYDLYLDTMLADLG